MSDWVTIQNFEAGASHKVCQMGGADYPFDSRGYGDALQETGFPLIRQWMEGGWGGDCRAEYARFLKTAIVHGSFPMLAVAAIAVNRLPTIYEEAVLSLPQKQKQRLGELLNIGSGNDDYGKYIKELSHVGKENRIQRGSNRGLETGRRGSPREGSTILAS